MSRHIVSPPAFCLAAPMITASFPRVSDPSELHTRAQVLGRPSPTPSAPGIYAWYFRRVPPGVDASGCHTVDGLTLLYVGISPKEAPTNGRAPSRSTLRQRLRTHFSGNAEGSTLRKTLGCLLAAETGFPLRRVGSGTRQTFTNPGEQALDDWMDENALVTWLVTDSAWELERRILHSGLPLPLNLRDNPCQAHTSFLKSVRSNAAAGALQLPVVGDSGGPRRRLLTAAKPIIAIA
jgi:hypothetical protein